MPRARSVIAITIALAVLATVFFWIQRDPPPPPQVLPWSWDDVVSVSLHPVRPDEGRDQYDMTNAEDLADFRRAVESAELRVTPNPGQNPIESMIRIIVTARDATKYRFRSAGDHRWLAVIGERGSAVTVELRGASLTQFIDARRAAAFQ